MFLGQTPRLAGVPKRTLYDWKARGIIAPSVQIIGMDGREDEGYSYADLAIIKLMRGLRDKKLNLRSVARTLRHLNDRFGGLTSPGWQNAHVYVFNKVVFAQKPDEWDTTVATMGGQKAMELLVGILFEEEAALLVLRSFANYVEIDPQVMEGIPVIRNTRVPTSVVALLAEQGTTIAELTDLYVPISRDFLQRAIDFERSLDRAETAVST